MITSLSIGRGGLGRMGNQMFTIAGTIGIAVNSNQPYAFPEWVNHDNALFGGEKTNLNDLLVNPLPAYIPDLNYKEYGYFWGFRSITLPTDSWTIDAHLQSSRYFSHCIDLVRHHFTFKDEPENYDYVAIHFRAGDYQEGANAYHPRCSVEYYKEAISHFPDSKFMLFSDDPLAAYNRLVEAGIDKRRLLPTAVNTNYIDDFKHMKRCHSFITANSTFSLMAAILGDQEGKKIVCPSAWFGPHVNLETKDIYPQGAIII